MLTEDKVDKLEAGPVADALCAVSMGKAVVHNGALLSMDDRGFRPSAASKFRAVSRLPAPAMEALKWLNDERLSEQRSSAGLIRMFDGEWQCYFYSEDRGGIDYSVDADSPELAIARAVIRIGMEQTTDAMQKAYEALTC